MELSAYLQIVSRRKWVIMTTIVLTLIVTVAGTQLMTPMYEATATLRVTTATSGAADSVAHDINYTDRLMNTYATIATSTPLRQQLAAKVGGVDASAIKVEHTANTELMLITVEDQNPSRAANAANALADLLIAYAKTTDTTVDEATQQSLINGLSQAENEMRTAQSAYDALVAKNPTDSAAITAAGRVVKMKEDTYATLLTLYQRVQLSLSVHITTISVIEPAAMPQVPAQPRKMLNYGLGFLVGVMGGVGLAFLMENLDSTLYTTDQVEKAAERPILGEIPTTNLKPGYSLDGSSRWAEAFRQVRTSLLSLAQDGSVHTVLVTSAEPGEGKSTIASHLAMAMTQSGRKVLLVDCDLRSPAIHQIFGLRNGLGLSSVLNGGVTLAKAVAYSPSAGLYVLTSGPLPPNPAELLGSAEMAALIERDLKEYDVVLLDAPSLLAVSDAGILAPAVDYVLLVVGRAQTRQNEVRAACRSLDRLRAKSVGVIINRAEPSDRYGYYTKHHSTHEQSGSMAEENRGPAAA